MTSRLSQPDTTADEDLRSLLDQDWPPSFVMLAGAGSGKTTSLVKALSRVQATHERRLRARQQRIACITYTEVAAQEINDDVGENELFHVSTIHSFFWTLVKPFQRDIRQWVADRLERKIEEAQFRHDKKGTRATTKAALIERIHRYKDQRPRIFTIDTFIYQVASSYGKGIVGHDDIINMVPELLAAKPLFARLAAQRFPFIFVDECQDTAPKVVEALKAIENARSEAVCLGFFGDPMQRIFVSGAGDVGAGEHWTKIDKPENFRCPEVVLGVINEIRRPVDGLVQKSGIKPAARRNGSLHIFALPADDRRAERLHQARRWLAENENDSAWLPDGSGGDTKILVIAHRMAALRLGFGNLYETFHDGASRSLKAEFDEDRAWPLRPFVETILPLLEARIREDRSVVARLRAVSPKLKPHNVIGKRISKLLESLGENLDKVVSVYEAGGAGSAGEVLRAVHNAELVELDDRYVAYLSKDKTTAEELLSPNVLEVLDRFMASDVLEVAAYKMYIEDNSLYATHHGVKGAEFSNVLVVLDDEDGRHFQYSYDKLLGAKDLSGTDRQNIEEGRDSVLERTRRLLYVCCSRATDSLAIAWFTADPGAASRALQESNFPGSDRVLSMDDLLVSHGTDDPLEAHENETVRPPEQSSLNEAKDGKSNIGDLANESGLPPKPDDDALF